MQEKNRLIYESASKETSFVMLSDQCDVCLKIRDGKVVNIEYKPQKRMKMNPLIPNKIVDK